MTAGEWVVQFHQADGGASKEPVYFQDFAATLKFVKAFKARASGATLRVLTPAKATYIERQQLIASDAIPL